MTSTELRLRNALPIGDRCGSEAPITDASLQLPLLPVGLPDVRSPKKGFSMRKLLLATAATLAIATPAAARDGSGYIGIDGGILFPRSQSGVFTSSFTQTTQTPPAGTTAPLP